MQEDLGKKIGNATKWSSITEISAKLVAPISSMVLARLLTPEAFGVVATINIIISFADMFTDAGFQKYLIQHRFKSEEDRFQSVTVAFWTNLFFSLLLWGIIAVFRDQIATLVGNPGLGNVIVIACVTLPMTSFSSIQMALFKRDFEFKIIVLCTISWGFNPIVCYRSTCVHVEELLGTHWRDYSSESF
jgi:PST family polysaccharide transporter